MTLSQLKNLRTIIAIVFIMFFISCTHTKSSSVIEYYLNGKVKSITSQLQDFKKVKTEFDSLGNITKLSTLDKDGRFDGEQVWFTNGIVEDKSVYKKGIANGHAYEFYTSGCIKTHRYVINGKETDMGTDYFDMSIGGVVKSYLYFNANGELYFKQTFDTLGNLIKEEGKRPTFSKVP